MRKMDGIVQAALPRWLVFVLAAILACSFTLQVDAAAEGKALEKIATPDEELGESAMPDDASAKTDIAAVQAWETLAINEKYQEFALQNTGYSVKSAVLDAEAIGPPLGSAAAKGRDDAGLLRSHDVQASSIKGIASDFAVAVRYVGGKTYYAACNDFYEPATLGDLIQGLGLRRSLTFHDIYTDAFVKEGARSRHVTAQYRLADPDVLWELLFSDPSAQLKPRSAKGSQKTASLESMDISVDYSVTGLQNVSIQVFEDGSLRTNIIAGGCTYDIGKERAQAFFDYVRSHAETVKNGKR